MQALRHVAAASAVALFTLPLFSQVPGRELASGNNTMQLRIEAEGSSGADAINRIQADAQQWSQTLCAIKPGSRPSSKSGPDGVSTVLTVQFANDASNLHLFLTLDRSSAICHLRAPAGVRTMFTMQAPVQRCLAELKSAAPNNTATTGAPPAVTPPTTAYNNRSPQQPATQQRPARPGAPPPAASADQPPAHPDNWNNVADVLFRTTYIGGVGGMMTIDYEPIVLFRDGSYFEIANQALEDVDMPAERAARPVHWGTWRAQGITYILTDNKGRPHDYKLQDGNLFKMFDASAAGGPLNMRYKRTTGGGNAALGGDISIMVQSNMNFTADGRFSSGQNVGMLNSGNTGGVSQSAGSNRGSGIGTYKLSKFTIELHYPDGRSERKFFGYASHHTPAQPDREMIFIGDQPFIHEK